MNRTQIFPTILIILDVAAAIGYGVDYNWRLSVYWLAAAVLTICVTF